MEHFKNIHELVFQKKEQYEEIVHKQIENYIRFLGMIASKTSLLASEELCTTINKNYGVKINRNEKQIIEGVIR